MKKYYKSQTEVVTEYIKQKLIPMMSEDPFRKIDYYKILKTITIDTEIQKQKVQEILDGFIESERLIEFRSLELPEHLVQEIIKEKEKKKEEIQDELKEGLPNG